MNTPQRSHVHELIVLGIIALGLIAILLGIIAGLFGWFASKASQPLPNWAENVLVAIATAAALKLGDAISALVALASGRQVEGLGQQLAQSGPVQQPKLLTNQTEDLDAAAAAAADETAQAAADQAAEIAGR